MCLGIFQSEISNNQNALWEAEAGTKMDASSDFFSAKRTTRLKCGNYEEELIGY